MIKKILPLCLVGCLIAPTGIQAKTNEQIYKDYATKVAQAYNIDPYLIQSIIMQESSYNPNATNGNCKGLMQIDETMHHFEMDKFNCDNLYSPFDNIDIGTFYLYTLMQENTDEYDEVDVSYILDLYNGNSKAKYNLEHGIMSDYSTEVLERAYQYQLDDNIQEGNYICGMK